MYPDRIMKTALSDLMDVSAWGAASLAISFFALITATTCMPGGEEENQNHPNVLIVLVDDMGTDQLRLYEPQSLSCTPNFEALAAVGTLHTRAYVHAVCSPTRAALLTGKYAQRTGVGNAVRKGDPTQGLGLELAELTLAEHLKANGYSTWAVGKWHLDGTQHQDTHPNQQGFDHYRGDLAGAPGLRSGPPPSYFDWDYTVDGTTTPDTRYITTVTASDALTLMAQATEPWLGLVSLNAVHAPYHHPPTGACPGAVTCACDAFLTGALAYPAMVESADAHIGAIVQAAFDMAGYNVVVIVIGDNGTPRQIPANLPCPRSGKGLLFEGGINVPLITHVPGQAGGLTNDALIGPTDIFATICDAVGISTPPEAQDSISAFPALLGAPGARQQVFIEMFSQNGLPLQIADYRRVIVEAEWKYIRRDPGFGTLPVEELFHLTSDPCEQLDILTTGAIPPDYNRLVDAMDLLEAP